MHRLYDNSPRYAVYDSVLEQKEFYSLWHSVQNESYTSVGEREWHKVWRLNDKTPWTSCEYRLSEQPFGTALDAIVESCMEICAENERILGKINEDWNEIIFRYYLYPRGTKLSWHNDSNNYVGAITYYVHPHWGSTWGGELMIAEIPSMNKPPDNLPAFDHQWEDQFLLHYGVGQSIMAKPNRLVLMRKGVMHAINRVDDDAGDNVRCSLVGFLKKV